VVDGAGEERLVLLARRPRRVLARFGFQAFRVGAGEMWGVASDSTGVPRLQRVRLESPRAVRR
jgi:hypothetical protein